MSKGASEDDDADIKSAPTAKMALLLLGTVADTTWRMFVPTLGGLGLGLWADKRWETTPLWTITGVIVGAILAFSLVYLQIKRVKK